MTKEVEVRSYIVIHFGRKQKWIGTWKDFKTTHPKARIKKVESVFDYKERMKPLNAKHEKTT